MKRMSIAKKYGYFWITLALFLFSLIGHWFFAWYAFVDEQRDHNRLPDVKEYVMQTTRDTLENWQSEFLQLIWQVAGLAVLLYVGSPSSKEGDERKEAKLDLILKRLDPENAERLLRELDERYVRK